MMQNMTRWEQNMSQEDFYKQLSAGWKQQAEAWQGMCGYYKQCYEELKVKMQELEAAINAK